MADTTEIEPLKIAPGVDAAPLLPDEEKKIPEIAPEKPQSEMLRLPDPILRTDHNMEPDPLAYRWAILTSFILAVICVGAISSFYNFLEVLLVDVWVFCLKK